MATIVLSVPHTGTRFLCSFLDSVGVIYRQYHSEPENLLDLGWEMNNKAVIPVRDPLLCFTSTLARDGINNVDFILNSVLTNFELLISLEDNFDYKYFNVLEPNFKEIHSFVNAPLSIPKELPKPVGMIADTPSNYRTWDIISRSIGDSNSKKVLRSLAGVRGHYGY